MVGWHQVSIIYSNTMCSGQQHGESVFVVKRQPRAQKRKKGQETPMIGHFQPIVSIGGV